MARVFVSGPTAQAPIPDDDVDDSALQERGLDAAAGGFDFREFGQARLLDLGFFVRDVLAHHGI